MMNRPRLPKRIRHHVNPLAHQSSFFFEGFPNTKPLLLDLGAYRGEFSEQLVKRFRTTHNFILTELRRPYLEYLQQLFADDEEVVVLGGDTSRTIEGLLKPSTQRGILVEYIFINFPDPWLKEKHKKRRVVNDSFLTTLKTLITPQTHLIFQTDELSLFTDTERIIQRQGGWQIRRFEEPLWEIQSYWETLKLREGKRIHRMDLTLQRG